MKYGICKNCGHGILISIKTNRASHISYHDSSGEEYSSLYCDCGCHYPRIASNSDKASWEALGIVKSYLHAEYADKAKIASNKYPKTYIKCECGCGGHGIFGVDNKNDTWKRFCITASIFSVIILYELFGYLLNIIPSNEALALLSITVVIMIATMKTV